MNFSKYALYLIALLILVTNVFADGMAFNPYDYHLEKIEQETQVAYIDFDGQQYILSLFVGLNLADYDKDKLIWIVPFKEMPADIDLKESNFYEFQQKFSEFDESLKNAIKLKKAFEEDFYTMSSIVASSYVPFGLSYSSFLLLMGPPGFKSYDIEELTPIKSFYFGELGNAYVYKISDKITLKKFFEIQNIESPENLSSFLNKNIVVFNINKLKQKEAILVNFKFNNNKEIFYPSSTTSLWKGIPKNYILKVRAPINYTLYPNLKPNLEINDTQYQYFVFSPSCAGLSDLKYRECAATLSKYSREHPDSYDFKEILGFDKKYGYLAKLYDTDLEIEVKEEKKAIPIGMYLVNAIEPLSFATLLMYLSWIIATFIYSYYYKKNFNKKEILICSFILLIIWTAINTGFSILFAIILIGGMDFLMAANLDKYLSILSRSTNWSLPIAFLLTLAFTIWLFKKSVIDKPEQVFSLTKGKIKRFRDFAIILVIAFVIYLVMLSAILLVFQIKI